MPKLTLRAARVNSGLTQAQAAKEIGVKDCTLLNWEKGRTFPNIEQIDKICKLYKVRYDDIIFLPNNPL